MDLLTPNSPGGLPTLSLTTNSSCLPWGRFAMLLISPLMPVPSWSCVSVMHTVVSSKRECNKGLVLDHWILRLKQLQQWFKYVGHMTHCSLYVVILSHQQQRQQRQHHHHQQQQQVKQQYNAFTLFTTTSSSISVMPTDIILYSIYRPLTCHTNTLNHGRTLRPQIYPTIQQN